MFHYSVAEVSASVFWRSPFSTLFDTNELKEFYILHIETANTRATTKKKLKVRTLVYPITIETMLFLGSVE